MKSQKVITVSDLSGNQYKLTSTKLVEVDGDNSTEFSRSVTRAAIAKFLQANKGKHIAYAHIRVYHPFHAQTIPGFGLNLSFGQLSIGCKDFDKAATKKIKLWALASVQTVRTRKTNRSTKAKAVAA